MRRTILAVAVLVAATGSAATASGGVKRHYSRSYHQAQHRCGDKTAPGRNIRRYGLHGDRTARAADYRRSIGTLKSMCRPVARSNVANNATPAVGSPAANTSQLGSGGAGGDLASIRACESRGSGGYQANTGNGYYGAYQFDQQTWNAHAPAGYRGTNPAAAPPAVQDQTAASTPRSAWPNC